MKILIVDDEALALTKGSSACWVHWDMKTL